MLSGAVGVQCRKVAGFYHVKHTSLKGPSGHTDFFRRNLFIQEEDSFVITAREGVDFSNPQFSAYHSQSDVERVAEHGDDNLARTWHWEAGNQRSGIPIEYYGIDLPPSRCPRHRDPHVHSDMPAYLQIYLIPFRLCATATLCVTYLNALS